MKRYFIVLIFFFCLMPFFSLAIKAQTTSNSVTIKGVVIDDSTKEKIPFVNVILYKNDSSIATTMTDTNGEFVIKTITDTNLLLECRFIGYKYKKKKINALNNCDIGVISMNQSYSGIIIDYYIMCGKPVRYPNPIGIGMTTITSDDPRLRF